MATLEARDIDELIEGLRELEHGTIGSRVVADFLAERPLAAGSLKPYLMFRDERYTRNLVYRDPSFEVMLLCWRPGQHTPVHSHNGQLGWMLLERGELEVANYRHLRCATPERQNVVDIDCLAGSTGVELELIGRQRVGPASGVSCVDKLQTIHAIACPPDAGPETVSLHVYSRPFTSCVVYDLEAGRCARRELFWDSAFGERLRE